MSLSKYKPFLHWIDSQSEEMMHLVINWAEINSGSFHLSGLSQMAAAFKEVCLPLADSFQETQLPSFLKMNDKGELITCRLSNALGFSKRCDSSLSVFLGGHLDTVFPSDHPFQKVIKKDGTLIGPGVADMKGGLVVMLTALRAFEQSPFADKLGWEILINPDEEIGSPGSKGLFQNYAKRNQVGLIFEPSLPDGSLIVSRKGSANFSVKVTGIASHAGRLLSESCNAIHAISIFISQLNQIASEYTDLTFNTGLITGGEAVNIVPDFALCRFNIRAWEKETLTNFEIAVHSIAKKIQESSGAIFQIKKETDRPPKPYSPEVKQLFQEMARCGEEIGLQLKEEASGGVCDGNLLAQAGLPILDSLGVQGGNLHTSEEFLSLSSLTQRAKLTALFLMKVAEGDIVIL